MRVPGPPTEIGTTSMTTSNYQDSVSIKRDGSCSRILFWETVVGVGLSPLPRNEEHIFGWLVGVDMTLRMLVGNFIKERAMSCLNKHAEYNCILDPTNGQQRGEPTNLGPSSIITSGDFVHNRLPTKNFKEEMPNRHGQLWC